MPLKDEHQQATLCLHRTRQRFVEERTATYNRLKGLLSEFGGVMTPRKPYPTDVTDEEWSFAVAYLTLMDEDAPQRRYELREMFNALR